LTADNLLSAQLVTADGQLITANARGKRRPYSEGRAAVVAILGHCFLEFRLHRSQPCYRFAPLSLEQARTVLHHLNEFITTTPDELTISLDFFRSPMVSAVSLTDLLWLARNG